MGGIFVTVLEMLGDLPCEEILGMSPWFDGTAVCGAARRDARCVERGDVFFCIRGTHFDGHTAIGQAACRGASLVVLEEMRYADTCPIPWICIRDTRAAFLPACLCAAGHPERGMHLYAVTGTNGKTSVTYLLEAMFSSDPEYAPCAVIGTVENRIAGENFPTSATTPPPEELCALLCHARERGVKTVILEASSHALAQGRLSGLHFDAGIFTNLTEDHLDYHGSMEDYFLCKRRLFFSCSSMIANADDPYGIRLLLDEDIPAEKISFSLAGNYPHAFRAQPHPVGNGTRLTVTSPDGAENELSSHLRGSFAAQNITAAAVCAYSAGLSHKTVQTGLSSLENIPGRMECIVETPFSVFVDYAHTPDALRRAICSVKNMPSDPGTTARTLVLFGCGGDREREKRPQMGAIASELADISIITSDNSRSEDPLAIIGDIVAGIPDSPHAEIHIVPDRKQAIETVLSLAHPGDSVLLAGKGHENYQIDRDGRHPFSEKEIVHNYIPREHVPHE